MMPRSHEIAREAPESARAAIIEALGTDNYFIYPDDRAFLRTHQFDPCAVVEDLSDYLKRGARLYILPGTFGKRIKFECCLRYEDITVLTKIARKDDAGSGWFVFLGFHQHNTGHAPLPE